MTAYQHNVFVNTTVLNKKKNNIGEITVVSAFQFKIRARYEIN